MKRLTFNYFKNLAFVTLLIIVVSSCTDRFIEESRSENLKDNSIIKKDYLSVTYRLNAWVKDKNGKSHLFDGEITINYNDGKPVTATFKGYYYGNYYDGVGIIFYINGDPNYSSFEKDPSTIFVDLLESLKIELE